MLHFFTTLVFKLLVPRQPILYLLPLPLTTAPCSWLFFYSSCFLSLLTLSGFFNGILEIFRPGALNYFIFFRPILLTSFESRNQILTHLLSVFSALRSDRTHSRSGIPSRDATHASGGVIIFVRQGLSFSELFTSSLSSLNPYSDYVEVNISLNNSSSLSFLNVYAPPTRSSPKDGRTDSFSPSILPSSRNLFILGDFNCHHPLWESKGTSNPCGKKYSTKSSPLTSFPSMTLIHPPFYIASLAVASFLTSPLPPLLLRFFAPERCFKTLVLTTYQFFLSVPLSPIFRPNERPPSFNFQKACWNDLASYFGSHCSSAEE